MSVWFTADLHLGHKNILEYCSRPFSSIEEHDAVLVMNWNSRVRSSDSVYVVGDFAFRSARDPQHYLERLAGRKHLIVGNHDGENTQTAPGWSSVQQLAEVRVADVRVVACHYALRVWPCDRRGAIHVYGHSHGNLPGDRRSLDVGVDCWGFQPVSLEEIRDRLRTLPEHAP